MWLKTINIKQFLSEETRDIEIVKNIGESIAGALTRGTKRFKCDTYGLDDILDMLRDIESLEDFNETLDELYDWADRNRVWLGP